jgi:phosphatidylglycerophosphate synthase
MFDAVVLADSPHASDRVLGLTLTERGRRVAARSGARRVFVVDGAEATARLLDWDQGRGDAALLVLRAGDQLVHYPLVEALLGGTSDRRIAVGPNGYAGGPDGYAGALWARGAAAAEAVAAIAAAPATADLELARRWSDAEAIPHGDIARHPATTRAERAGAARMLMQLLVKKTEDSPVSKYVYRPLSRPLTRLLLHTPITANQVSYVVALIGLLGCWFTARPGHQNLVIGAALVFVSGIIDGCDGEISRMRLTSSKFGAWLDTIIDELTSTSYFVAIGYHTYTRQPEPWVAYTLVIGTLCYIATIYAIYYFCIVVWKAGGSQYYIGKLDLVEDASGPALKPRPRSPSSTPWIEKTREVLLLMVRRDFINLGALVVALFDGYLLIYVPILAGTIFSAAIVVPEHLGLRRQLRALARRGAAPRLVRS